MNSLQVKRLISKLTGVPLSKEGMAMFWKQRSLKRRQLLWHRIQSGNELKNVPNVMANYITNLLNSFQQGFSQYSSDSNFSNVVFAWYAEDASLGQKDVDLIEQFAPPNLKDEFKRISEFIQRTGVVLSFSPNEAQGSMDKFNRAGCNGGSYYESCMGWAWGAQSVAMKDSGSRRTKFVAPEEASRRANDPNEVQSMMERNESLIEIVTAEKNNRWGIFFDDGIQKIPVMPSALLAAVNDRKEYKAKTENYGYFTKFYGYRSLVQDIQPTTFTPMETRFELDSPEDPQPKGILWAARATAKSVAHDGRLGPNYRNDPAKYDKVWIACVHDDGTMYWEKQSDRNVKMDMTEQQVDFLNIKKGSHWVLSEPGIPRYQFEDRNSPEYQQFIHDTSVMNSLRDFLRQYGEEDRHVASQSYQVIIVGPKFQSAQQVGKEQTPAKMVTHHTLSEELDDGNAVGWRASWVVVKDEFGLSDFRGEKATTIPQDASGMSERGGRATLEQAIQDVAQRGVPENLLPNPQEIAAAEQSLANANQQASSMGQHTQTPYQNNNQQLKQNVPPVQQPSTQPSPQTVQQPSISQPVVPNIEGVVAAKDEKTSMNKTASDLIRELKKLC